MFHNADAAVIAHQVAQKVVYHRNGASEQAIDNG